MKKTIATIIAMFCIISYSIAQSTYTPDAEYNLLRRTYQFNADGSLDISYRKELKLIRNRAITEYADKGETFILYNPQTDSLIINESYTLLPDGKKINTPFNAFINQLPSECSDCDSYHELREMAIVHTALVPECIIVLDYTIHRIGDPKIQEQVILAEDCPIQQYELTIKSSLKKFYYSANNIPSNAIQKSDEGYYNLSLTQIPQTHNDPYLPNASTLYPTIYITNHLDGNTLADFNAITSTPLHISDTLQKYLYREKNEEHIKVIRNHVIEQIKTNHIPSSLIGYRYQTAQNTYNNQCGTLTDKAILLTALYQKAGYQATLIPGTKEVVVTDGKKNHTTKMFDEQSISIEVIADGLTYLVYPNQEQKMHLVGAAIDNAYIIDTARTLEWNPKELEDGYFMFEIPQEKSQFNIHPSQLTSNRKSPIKLHPVDEHFQYTIMLPYNVKMIGKNVNIHKSENGIGSVEITIKQIGNKLTINKHLAITTDTINPEQYKKFRELVKLWYSNHELYFKQ